MFQKPAFGAASSTGFGSFSSSATTSSPFGFKPTAGTSAFGAAPAFGAAATSQPSTSGGLFGATNNTTGGLFGNTNATPAPAFGATASTFGSTFGSTPATGGGLFGNNQNQSGGLFGNTQNNSAFGAKPAGFGFGATTSNNTSGGGLFGSTPAATGGLFGQQNTTLGGGGLFGSTATTSFGQQQQPSGTGHVKYNPVTGTDVVVKSGTSQSVNTKHLCITCMKEYEGKCLEELRLEDYMAGRKGPSQTGFGGFQATENKPLFGATTTFGQPATTSAPSVFGGGGLGTSTFGQPSTFSFGGNTQTNTQTTSLFGANKPAFGATSTAGTIGTGLFGTTTTTQAAPAFGANTSAFGFGANTNQQSGGLFGAKPAGTAAATTGFGSFGNTGGVFGANKPATNTGFGTTSLGGFGTSTANTGGLFGASTFGKPNTSQPTFGLTQTPAMGTGLGAANPLQAKPTGFGSLGGGSMFQQPQTNTFNTGLNTGLGGGLFGNNSTLGGGLGMPGINANVGFNSSGPAANNAAVHEQILTAVARPYGGSALFKDLLPDTSTTAEDVLKPTNPAAVKAALDKSQYKLTSPAQTLKLKPRAHCDKKSLFDGLEEADASLEDKLSLKPSRKRLVLRPNAYNRENSDPLAENRSLEENRVNAIASPIERDRGSQNNAPDKDRNIPASDKDERRPFSENNHFDSSTDRHVSWVTSPQQQIWNSKETQADVESTPRIYPQLDKELPNEGEERRASWLTTKPLRKPLHSNLDSESSVRELIRNDIQRQQDIQISREKSMEASPERLSMTEEEHVPGSSPHPAGVKLTRPGYYTTPSLNDMIGYIRPDGRCVLPSLTIGRTNYGNVFFDCEIDVTGLDLDSLVHFLNKEVIIYPDDANKPPVGEGLNRRAIVTLDRIWPRDKTDKRAITSPDRLLKMDYEGKLRRVCDKHDTKFIEYRPETGSWVFRVEHFSKYGLTDSDEDDDITPEVMKRQIAHQQLQKAAPIPPKPIQPPGLGGLGGLGGFGGLEQSTALGKVTVPAMDDRLFNTSLNLINGSAKAFEMDTTENMELQSMYTDMERAFAVKSPTSELAKLEHRHSHNVQLMKASLYADAEMEEEDTSVSTHDQQVPTLGAATIHRESTPPPSTEILAVDSRQPPIESATDQPMKPLIVHPKTVVLHYHRKVPPFKQTIAGRLNASYIADMRVCRARHSRVGFGPGSSLAFVTSYNSVADLPKNADLCAMGNYFEGRSENDWSPQVVATVKIGNPKIQETLTKHIEALLEHSTCVQRDNSCPVYTVEDKLGLLRQHVKIAGQADLDVKYGVTSAYCLEVWKLCEALWGADLENGGIPGTDDQSIVNRYRSFLHWITEAVSTVTNDALAESKAAEIEDDCDYHSARVWTLLLGGRTLEACKLAAEHGDLNMAAIMAQGGDDPLFRSLVSRQLSTWVECGSTKLISSHRVATLQLLSGVPPRSLSQCHWMAAFRATARYLCIQIPSLEQIVRKYESLFQTDDEPEEEADFDMTTVEDGGMQYPNPPHLVDYEFEVSGGKKPRRILDLRYELIRARAFNSRPKLQTAAYTPDPFDYSLCFLLSTWFGIPSDEVCASFASQLEENGAWHLAVACLAYVQNDVTRTRLIRGVLSRNAPSTADLARGGVQVALLRRIGVPPQWIAIAQAHRAKYEHRPLTEAQHLAAAHQWESAHNVLMNELFASSVLNDDLQSITPLLEKMSEAAAESLVPGWERGGKALYHYAVLSNEILGAINETEPRQAEINSKLKTLRPHVVALCNSLSNLKPSSGSMTAAVAEMWSRVSRVGTFGALALPPDTTHAHHMLLLSELCERASEICMESANDTSPIAQRMITQRS